MPALLSGIFSILCEAILGDVDCDGCGGAVAEDSDLHGVADANVEHQINNVVLTGDIDGLIVDAYADEDVARFELVSGEGIA